MKTQELTFTGLRTRTVNVSVKRPVISRIGSFENWAFICVDVETAGGITGRSYISPYLIGQAAAVSNCITALAHPLEGRVISPATFYDESMRRISLMGKSGIALYALAALDMAFWDAHAKAAGQPLAVHLGGTIEPVKAYNSSGLWLAPIDTLARETEALIAEGGFSAVKVRLGRETTGDDRNAIAEVRKAAGPDIAVMSDFNQGLTFSDALHRLRALDDAGLYWFEEPIAYHDLENCATLARKTKTPITLGENFHGPRDLHAALSARACDMVMPDVMRIGGVTGWLRAAAIAEQAGIDLSSHLFPEVSAHLMRVTPTAHWLEWTDWANPILADPFALKDGHVVIPDRPGSGIAWNEDALATYRV